MGAGDSGVNANYGRNYRYFHRGRAGLGFGRITAGMVGEVEEGGYAGGIYCTAICGSRGDMGGGGMSQYTFNLTGKIIPAVRMTNRSKFGDPRAQAYLVSQMDLKWQLKQQMQENDWPMLPEKTPLAVELQIGTDQLHTCDIDNCLKSVLDSANKIIYADDRWIDKVSAWRYVAGEDKAVLIVWERWIG